MSFAPMDRHETRTFNEPWEAHAFALVIALHERGLFTWTQWADALAAEIRNAQAGGDPDAGDTYYHHWLRALEAIVVARGASSPNELERCRDAWLNAAARTPHGHPIEVTANDYP